MKHIIALLALITTHTFAGGGSLEAEEFRFYQDLRDSVESFTLELHYGGTLVEQWEGIPDPSIHTVYIDGVAPKVYQAVLFARDKDFNILFWDSIEADFTSGHADISFRLRANQRPWDNNSYASATTDYEYFDILRDGFWVNLGASGSEYFKDVPLKAGQEVHFYAYNSKQITVYNGNDLAASIEAEELHFTVEETGAYTFIASGEPEQQVYVYISY